VGPRAILDTVVKRKIPSRRSRKNNIKMFLTEAVCEGADWIQLSEDKEQWRASMSRFIDLQVS
jgi:hypothetical protein